MANKIDLESRRMVSPKEGRDFAENHGLEYCECSAVSFTAYNCFLKSDTLLVVV